MQSERETTKREIIITLDTAIDNDNTSEHETSLYDGDNDDTAIKQSWGIDKKPL